MPKVTSIFVKFWLFYDAPHQIWSCHVAQEASFKHFLFCPNSTFNITKSHKISSRKTLYFRSYQPKTSRGGGGWGSGGKHSPALPLKLNKGPMKLMQLHGKNIFTVCVRSVPRYYFKLAYVVLQMAVKEFFETYPFILDLKHSYYVFCYSLAF